MDKGIEIFRDIPKYEGLYQISNWGRVRSLPRNNTKGKILKSQHDNYGYLIICLSKNNKRSTKTIHTIVAIVFLPNPHNLPCVNHKDENKENNFVWVNEDGTVDPEKSNLEYCTVAYNNAYGTKGKRTAEKQGFPVIQLLNGNIIARYPSASEAARQTGFSQGCISRCCRGERKSYKGYQWEYVK